MSEDDLIICKVEPEKVREYVEKHDSKHKEWFEDKLEKWENDTINDFNLATLRGATLVARWT